MLRPLYEAKSGRQVPARKQVPNGNLHMIMEMYRVESRAIRAVGYDEATRRMRIVFAQGNTHDYCDVPQDVFESLLSAKSKGAYFNRIIKDKYEC